MLQYDYGFIGAGRMATALAGGLVEGGRATGEQIAASDPSEDVGRRFSAAVPGANVVDDNGKVARNSAVVILAVKPQVIDAAIQSVSAAIGGEQVVVSIAAGITVARLEQKLPPGTRVVRVMPNTPCLIGRGASGYSLGSSAKPGDGELVDRMLKAVGIALELPEPLLDGVTGLSGSGPAFVYTVIEALSDG
ncbi:MAG: pyrroline-5-carboxylate reductase family protein, partial [Aeoliella sp.]